MFKLLGSLNESLFISTKKLDQEQFPYPWSEEAWEQAKSDSQYFWVGGEFEELQGFVLFSYIEESKAELLKILVDQEMRGTKVSTELWSQALEFLREKEILEVFLEVSVENLRAIAFYQRLGFKELARRKRFYSDGSDALTLKLNVLSEITAK